MLMTNTKTIASSVLRLTSAPFLLSKRQLCLKILKVSFTPGFSQVDRRPFQLGNRLNGFHSKNCICYTWLKPGANEKKRLHRIRKHFEAKHQRALSFRR